MNRRTKKLLELLGIKETFMIKWAAENYNADDEECNDMDDLLETASELWDEMDINGYIEDLDGFPRHFTAYLS